MTAKAESRYHTLLQVAAGSRRRADTAAVNMTYTASVAAVDATTPSASQGLISINVRTSNSPNVTITVTFPVEDFAQ